jgi:hypothetical protein
MIPAQKAEFYHNHAGPESRYRLIPLVRYAAGQGSVLLYSQFAGSVRIMPQTAADRLLSCTGFLTLDEHARNLQGRAGGDFERLRLELCAYAQEGLFVSDTELVSSVQNGNAAARRVPITSIAIPTRDRPELLLRAVAG